jgi:hypothetical protein
MGVRLIEGSKKYAVKSVRSDWGCMTATGQSKRRATLGQAHNRAKKYPGRSQVTVSANETGTFRRARIQLPRLGVSGPPAIGACAIGSFTVHHPQRVETTR